MLIFDSKKMHSDILKKLYLVGKPQKYLTEKLNVSRSTFWRLSQNKEVTMQSFLILINWLDKDPNKYIVETNTRKRDKQNRILKIEKSKFND